MAEKSYHCQLCNCTLYGMKEFDLHCNGKKHKSNEKHGNEQEDAKRKIYVRGLEGITNPRDFLFKYFCNFGSLNDIKIGGNQDSSFAVVEFCEREPVARCLKMKHMIGGQCLYVKSYKNRTPTSGVSRMAHQKLEQDEKTKQAATTSHAMDILLSAASLTDQINLLAACLKLDAADEKARVQICQELTKLLSPLFEHCKICQFGSSVNGFGAKGCDLDLFLDLNDQVPSVSDGKKNKVKKLARAITASPRFINTLTIPSNRCPVVRFAHKATGIKCDLSVNNRKALHNSYLLRLYSSEPRVHKLVSIVRLWARTMGLAGSTSMAHLLTSYSITLIVLFFVMHRKPHIVPLVCDIEKFVKGTRSEVVDDWECITIPADAKLPPSENKDSEVELVKEFFAFCSGSIDWDLDALVMKDATKIPRSEISQNPIYIGCKAACLTVLDPFVLTHNVVGNVNEKTKLKFVAELKRAAEMTREWPSNIIKSDSAPWGLAALLVPSLEDTTNVQGKKAARKAKKALKACNATSGDAAKVDSTKPSITRVEGEQENGEFCVTIQPLPQTMSCSKLLHAATQNNLKPAEQWCTMAQEIILCILKTVFLVDVEEAESTGKKETDQNVDVIKQDDDGNGKDQMNVTEKENNGCMLKDIDGNEVTDHSVDKDNEMECEVNEASFGKRTCEVADLDGNNVDVMYVSNSESSSLSGDSNPKKRFCEGVGSEAAQSSRGMTVDQDNDSVMKHIDNKSKDILGDSMTALADNDSNIVLNDNRDWANSSTSAHVQAFPLPGTSETSSVVTQDTSEAHTDSSTYSGAISQIKTSKIVTYFCKCRHQLWISRRKLGSQLTNKQFLSPLALEQVITKLALRKQNNITKIITEKDAAERVQNEDKSRTDCARDLPRRKGTDKDEKMDALMIFKDQSNITDNFPELSQKNQLPVIEFSCQVFHQNCDADFKLPHVLIKLRPAESSCKQFKNFYCSFRSQVLNLVTQHIQDSFN